MFKPHETDIIPRVRLLFVGVLLLLSFVGFAQTQLRCLEVKGKGFVQARSDVSCVENATERPCAIFTVEIGKEVSFSIKPSAQYYLEKIEIEDTSGTIKEVAREKIYAERNDTLYYQCNDTINVKYRFIFKEVQPWSGLMYPPYGGPDRGFYLIYTPEEFIYACKTKISIYNFRGRTQTISLQNDLDFDKKSMMTLRDELTLQSKYYEIFVEILGNNKIVKNCFYTKLPAQKESYATFLYLAKRIVNLHIQKGNMSPFYFAEDGMTRSIVGCTSNADLLGASRTFRYTTPGLQAENCINFGDKSGNIPFFLLGLPNVQKNLINCGASQGDCFTTYKQGPACFWFIGSQSHESNKLLYLLNLGRDEYFSNFTTPIDQSFFINNADLGSRECAENGVITQNYFNISNHKLIDSAFMRSLMGESAEQDFIFEDGFYPRLRHMDERPGRLAASPILFARGENADSIKHPFYVDTNYGVRWISLSPGLVDIVGDSGYVRMPVAEDSVVRIEAWKEDFSKHVYLTIRARSFVDKEIGYDTVCHGDSVWMKNTYARNEGWNYDVVWGEGTDTSPDTVYRLHLHHKRVYRDTLHFEVARDSLPYIYKEDTIKWFGLTELHRYLTIEGCDSIIYVQLDTLDNRREIHHWDTLCLCSGDTSVRYWRGVPITGVGEVYDEVIDPYKGGIDTFYHLQSYISPTYRDTLYFLVERDSLPYIHGKDTIRQFGWTTLKALTVHGCDSITYVRLDTLYIHREQHFYDTLHTCEGGTLSWRDREITHTGDYTDTVFDPYKGGTDSIHHLRALVYPVHHTTYIDSCYIEELPYMVGGRLMQDFGEQTERYVTVEGCDSVYTYVLAPRWHPSQVHGVVTIEGDGIVCMQENTFQGAGTYVFEVEEGSEFHFRIKPGKQFYLDSLWVGGGMPLPVSRDSIYAERDDTLHYYYRIAQGNIGFHFIFKEVQPWQGGVDKAYRSKDKSYVQIYRPEELFVREIQTISLQNNLDFACIDNSQYRLHTNLQYFQGNDKILYNLCNFEIFNIHFNDHTKMSNLHLRGRSSWAISMDRTFFNGITIGSDVSVSGMYSLPTSFFPMQFINCIFFSDNLDSHYTYAAFRLYKTSKNLINWGKGSVCVYVHRYNDSVYISNIFNFGRNKKLISCENGVGPKIFFSYFNDKNLVPDIELPTHEWTVGYNLESRQLIDSAFMRSLMGDSAEEDFIFEDGFYPRLRHMDERPGRLAASPILLYPGENADSVTLPFYVDTNYGVRWVSLNEDIIRIEGNVGYVRHPVPKETTVRVEAWKEDFNKHVYLDVPASNFVYQDLLSDTVCPGDSVKMINSYARNEGWNYEVVETASAEYDTIYRMYLHHYPTYREVVHRAAVERDSLPYIFGRDTIRNFGLTELHRYQSVHGCDSITYVRLDTLYIHREQHFYDTLHTCEGGTLSWRGREITQTGEYADTVFDPYRGGTDSIHHLRADLYPKYHDTFIDSCYMEDLPYTVGGRVFSSFGEYTEILVTTAGCDSVREYGLSRRWRQYRVHVEVKGEGFVNVTDTTLREDGSLWLDFTASACNKLDSLKIDGRNVPPQNRYELKDLHGDCEVEAVFGSTVSTESVLRYEVCGDSLPLIYNGEAYGAGEHTIVLRSAQGCDSVVRLQVQGKENTARIAVVDTIAPPCGASEIAFSYRTETGAPKHLRLAFDPAAKSAGFRDTVLAVGSTGLQTVRIALPPTARPDRYGLRLRQADGTGCYAEEEALTFEIPYPSDIIVQKWSDVLAVLSADYNGGYEFSGYQWYKNGEPMEGETRPYLYVKPYLRSTDTYAALLERASDGLKLQSCGVKRKGYPKAFSLELLPNPTSAGGEVRVSVNGKPEAEGTIEVFDGTGKPVYQRAFRRSHTLRANWQPGSYVVRVHDGKGKWIATGKLLVQ